MKNQKGPPPPAPKQTAPQIDVPFLQFDPAWEIRLCTDCPRHLNVHLEFIVRMKNSKKEVSVIIDTCMDKPMWEVFPYSDPGLVINEFRCELHETEKLLEAISKSI